MTFFHNWSGLDGDQRATHQQYLYVPGFLLFGGFIFSHRFGYQYISRILRNLGAEPTSILGNNKTHTDFGCGGGHPVSVSPEICKKVINYETCCEVRCQDVKFSEYRMKFQGWNRIELKITTQIQPKSSLLETVETRSKHQKNISARYHSNQLTPHFHLSLPCFSPTCNLILQLTLLANARWTNLEVCRRFGFLGNLKKCWRRKNSPFGKPMGVFLMEDEVSKCSSVHSYWDVRLP